MSIRDALPSSFDLQRRTTPQDKEGENETFEAYESKMGVFTVAKPKFHTYTYTCRAESG